MCKNSVFLAVIPIILIELLLFLANYIPGTTLAGWDGLYPEFNFPLNLSRDFFGVWQEVRGLGLWDGMSHASNLIHTIFLWLMSIAIPTDLLRYIFIFGMHLLGMIGMYLLLSYLLKNKWVALFGGLFYGFNLGIIQMFYAPLEVFAIHFAFLPFLTYALLNYLSYSTKRKLLLFALLSFLSTPQGYVPQIFISYLILISSILTVFLFYRPWNNETVKQCLMVIVTIFCTNAFWFLPYVGGLPQNAPVIINSKINQMASDRIYLMNQYRGDLLDVFTLKGFMIDMTDVGNNGVVGYIMPEWREYTSSVFFIIPSLLFALLTLFGIVHAVRSQTRILYPFVGVFSITFFFLGNNIPILNLANAFIRWLLPVFNEAFRFPFTKFETLFAFSYTIFLVYGIIELSEYFLKKETPGYSQFSGDLKVGFVKNTVLSIPWVANFHLARTETDIMILPSVAERLLKLGRLMAHSTTTFSFILSLCLLLYSLPTFTGHFLYSGVRVGIEPEYKQVLSYFNSVSPTARIAPLPQPTFYNWEYHANGYRGSGFLWFGLPQSMMERSFDPWSNYNEGYYWELSQALYSQNADLLKSVLNKYQIAYVMLDENRIYPFSPSSLYFPETKDLLAKAGLKQIKIFGKITIYQNPAQSLVFAAQNLPSINSYSFGSIDQAYLQHGTYESPNTPLTLIYPFRSLFTQRAPQEKDFSLGDSQNTLVFSTTIPENISHVLIPSFVSLEKLIPTTLYLKRDSKGIYTIYSIVSTPTIVVGGQKIWGESFTYPLFTLPKHPAFPLTISVNGQHFTTLKNFKDSQLGTTLFSTVEDNSIDISDSKDGGLNTTIASSRIASDVGKPASITFASHGPVTFSVAVAKITDKAYAYSPNPKNASVIDCNTFQNGTISSANHTSLILSAQLADACTSFVNNNTNTSLGYVVLINHSHNSGQPLNFWVEDETDQYAFSQVDLQNTNTPTTDSLILPPMQGENVGYSYHFDNPATSTDLTQNTLSRMSVYPIPFTFLQSLETDSQQPLPVSSSTPLLFDHPNPSLYTITFPSSDNQTIVLSQSYDAGWKAYSMPISNFQFPIFNFLEDVFPFWFGSELTDHVKVNNWENGWNIGQNLGSSNQQLVIVFLPQYLEYIGFVMLVGFWIYLIFSKQHSST